MTEVHLAVLALGARHGYEVKKQVDAWFPQGRPLAFGQVYATLGRLVRDGLAEVAETRTEGGPERTVYAVTDAGRERLHAWIAEPAAPSAWDGEDIVRKTVAALHVVATPEAAREFLARQRTAHLRRLRDLVEAAARAPSVPDHLVHRHALLHLDADLRWLDEAVAALAHPALVHRALVHPELVHPNLAHPSASPKGPRMTIPTDATGSDALVHLDAVAHAYARTTALQGLTLTVRPGEVVALTGPSGSGKSTALHVAAGLLRPQAGRVSLLGTDVTTLSDDARAALRRRHVGIVLQYGQLVPDLPLLDNVALPLLLDGSDVRAARTAAAAALEQVGLSGESAAVPAEVSGGQAQRAAVARVIVRRPRVVLADEPVASLDAAGGAAMLDLLLQTARGASAAGGVLLVTHDNTVAARADCEVRLRDGRLDYAAVLR